MARPEKSCIDAIKTVVWFNFITQTTSINPYNLQQKLNQNTKFGHNSNKCYRWRNGSRTPSKRNVSEVEKIVPGSAKLFYHPLWEILNDPFAFKTLFDVEKLLLGLPYPKWVLFQKALSNSKKLVRIARPLNAHTAEELRYIDEPSQRYFVNDLENIDRMAAQLILAREAKILGSHKGQVVSLKLFEESKPLIRKIPELKGVVKLLFQYIELTSAWEHPGPEEQSAQKAFMRDLALGIGFDTDPPYQWIPAQEALLGKMPDEALAERLCLPQAAIWYRRYQLGIFEFSENI